MMVLSKRTKLALLAASGLGLAIIGLANYTGACRLETVTYDGENLTDWPEKFEALESSPLFHQPLDSLAQALLARPQVFKVDMSWSLPHTLEITTNRFSPVCFVLDSKTDRMMGVDRTGRIVSLNGSKLDWENPVLVNVEVERMFERCGDVRVAMVADRLPGIRDKYRDLYRLIEEIDFGESGCLSIRISGLPYQLKVRAGLMSEDIDRFVQFVTEYGPDLSEARIVDLRFDNMVICDGGKG